MKIYKIIIFSLLSLCYIFTSCTTDDGPDIDDYYLNYQIGEIPVKSDIPVGAYLQTVSGAFNNDAVWERIIQPYDEKNGQVGPNVQPSLGRYSLSLNYEGAGNMQQLINWAAEAKIDFLISPAVTENGSLLYPNNMNVNSSNFLNFMSGRDTLGVNMGDVGFCILVDMNAFCSGLSNNVLLEDAPTTTIKVNGVDTVLTREGRLYSYFKRISDYFDDDHYYHIDGRPMVVLNSPEKLYTSDSRRVYNAIRDTIKSHTGKDVYIVARQTAWTPSARFHYFFMTGGVDAVTMHNMAAVGAGNYDRIYWLNQLINENLKYNREYISTNYDIDFIPSASPAYNGYIVNGAYNIPHVQKNPDEFKKRCNVAKMNLGKNPMVLIDSFNNWQYDSQIEPTDDQYGRGYGKQYLDIVRTQFKK